MAGQTDEKRKNCPQCGRGNALDARFCVGCGRPFSADYVTDGAFDEKRSRSLDPAAFRPDAPMGADRFGGISAADAARAVGKNEKYYLPVFERLSHSQKTGRFHLAALFFGGGWMLYRKQYASGAIVLSLQLLLRALTLVSGYLYTLPILRGAYAAAGVTASQSTVTREQSEAVLRALAGLSAGGLLLCCLPLIFSVMGLICSVVVASNANRWYFHHVTKLVEQADKQPFVTPEERGAELSRRGGVNLPLAGCLVVCGMILYKYSGTIISAIFS